MVQAGARDLSPEALGFVLPHEHVLYDMYDVTMNSHLILSDKRVALEELQQYRALGGQTIVDQTVHGLHPDRESVVEVCDAAGVQVVFGTGFYWEKFHPPWLADMSDIEIVQFLVDDITVGKAGGGVRAGFIGEIGTHHREISPAEKRVLRACAAAQRETRVPIGTHALFTRIGMEQLRTLSDAGADLDKVVIGHADTTPDIDYQESLLREGVWIAYDSVGQLDKQSDESRADAILELVGRGWAERILVSSDVGKRGALRAYGGGGYGHVIATFLPLLRERGGDDTLIDTLTRDNPRRLFTFDD